MNNRVKNAGLAMLLLVLGAFTVFATPYNDCPGIYPCPEPSDPNFSIGYTHIYFYDYNSTIEQGQYVYLDGNFTLVDQGNATLGLFHSNQTIILNESSFMYVHPIMNFSLFYANGFQIWGNGFLDMNPIIISIPFNRTIA